MWDAMRLRNIARACRIAAVQAHKDAERMEQSSQAKMKLEEERQFLEDAAELEELAKGRS
jgi:hypothetical protein